MRHFKINKFLSTARVEIQIAPCKGCCQVFPISRSGAIKANWPGPRYKCNAQVRKVVIRLPDKVTVMQP